MTTPTTYEICKYIRKRFTLAASDACMYTNWPDEFKLQSVLQVPDDIKNADGYRPVNVTDLSEQEMEELGFGLWDEESKLMLVPVWLLPFLDPDVLLTSISGDTASPVDVDNDQRFGCLAYGVVK